MISRAMRGMPGIDATELYRRGGCAEVLHFSTTAVDDGGRRLAESLRCAAPPSGWPRWPVTWSPTHSQRAADREGCPVAGALPRRTAWSYPGNVPGRYPARTVSGSGPSLSRPPHERVPDLMRRAGSAGSGAAHPRTGTSPRRWCAPSTAGTQVSDAPDTGGRHQRQAIMGGRELRRALPVMAVRRLRGVRFACPSGCKPQTAPAVP